MIAYAACGYHNVGLIEVGKLLNQIWDDIWRASRELEGQLMFFLRANRDFFCIPDKCRGAQSSLKCWENSLNFAVQFWFQFHFSIVLLDAKIIWKSHSSRSNENRVIDQNLIDAISSSSKRLFSIDIPGIIHRHYRIKSSCEAPSERWFVNFLSALKSCDDGRKECFMIANLIHER